MQRMSTSKGHSPLRRLNLGTSRGKTWNCTDLTLQDGNVCPVDGTQNPMPTPTRLTTSPELIILAEEKPEEKPIQIFLYCTKDESDNTVTEGEIGVCGYVLIGLSYLLVILTFPVSLLICLKVVQEYERAVIFRLGRIKSSRAQGPGLFFLLPCADNFMKVDLRTFNYNIPPQEILTKDSVTCVVDAVLYARVCDATKSVVNIMNARASVNLLGATTLRTVVGTVGLSDLLSDRERIDHVMQETLDRATEQWGVKVERVEIKDVRLPMQMQRAMAAEAEAGREARAKIVAADGELKASRSLKEAADVLSETPTSLQLRYLQTLHSVSEEQNHTIIFPFPPSLFSSSAKETLGPLARSLAGAQQSQENQPLINLQQTEDHTQF